MAPCTPTPSLPPPRPLMLTPTPVPPSPPPLRPTRPPTPLLFPSPPNPHLSAAHPSPAPLIPLLSPILFKQGALRELGHEHRKKRRQTPCINEGKSKRPPTSFRHTTKSQHHCQKRVHTLYIARQPAKHHGCQPRMHKGMSEGVPACPSASIRTQAKPQHQRSMQPRRMERKGHEKN